MNKTKLLTAVLLLSICGFTARAIALPDSIYHYMAEFQATMSSGKSTPFWLVNNRQGLSSLDKHNGYLRGGFFREFQMDRRFSWDFGVDLVVPYNYTSHFVVQQLYAGVRYRSLSLTIGSQEWTNGIVSSELSSGDMLFSQNSRPIPQARLEMKEYNFVPWTKQWLAVKGYFSFGAYTDSKWERNHTGPDGDWSEHRLFHSKGVFLRGGNPDRFPLTVDGGLEMGAQFGGTCYRKNPITGDRDVIKFTHSLKDIIKVIIPSSGGSADDPNQMGEITNVLGNHVGQWSLAVNWTPKNQDWAARVYYEHFFEDHSQMLFDHAWKDMLLGVQLTLPQNPFVSKFVYEYLITKDQSGAVYWDHLPEIDSQISGRDDYYNQGLYGNWQHWGMGTGNPLLISPIYNADGSLFFMHNRIKGHHFGWEGRPHPDVDYRVLMSLTRSWGTYRSPTPDILHNFNALLEVSYRPHQLKGWKATLGLAADAGKLLGKSFGAQLTISKTGWL